MNETDSEVNRGKLRLKYAEERQKPQKMGKATEMKKKKQVTMWRKKRRLNKIQTRSNFSVLIKNNHMWIVEWVN